MRGEPFQLTTEPFTKFVPFTVSVKLVKPQDGAELEDVTEDDREATVGGTIVNEAPPDVPPPGPKVNTRTCALPVVRKSVAGNVALS